MEHQIDGVELVSKKVTKQRFRASIFDAWHDRCAYCGRHATTIDHVRPKAKGGLTVPENCVPACLSCNASKGHMSLWTWWTMQHHWSWHRAQQVYEWITGIGCPSSVRYKFAPAIDHWHIDR
jgi:hypothetical protein